MVSEGSEEENSMQHNEMEDTSIEKDRKIVIFNKKYIYIIVLYTL